MTPLEKFIEYMGKDATKNLNTKYYLELEEKTIKDAILHSLDEDGHTGDWKLNFANEYYNKLKNNL